MALSEREELEMLELEQREKFQDIKHTGATGPGSPFVPSGEKNLSWANPELLAAHPSVRVLKGAARGGMGLMQLGGNLNDVVYKGLGLPFRPGEALNEKIAQESQMEQAGRKEFGSRGFDWWKAGGTLGDPLLVKGGEMVGNATGKIQRALTGAEVGAAAGASEPVTNEGHYWRDKASQVPVGTIVGGAVPAGIDLVKSAATRASHATDLVTPWGPRRIAERHMRNIVGDEQAPTVVDALEKSHNIVPKSEPTSAQAVAHIPEGSPVIAQQKITAAQEGGISSEFGHRFDDQINARRAALAKLASTNDLDRQRVARALEKSLYDPVTQRETPTKFLRAIENEYKLVQKHTGFGSSLRNLFTPNQYKALMNVAEEVGTNVSMANPVQKTALGGGVNVTKETGTQLPRMLSTPMTLLNSALNLVRKDVTPKVEKSLSEMFLNPQILAEVLKKTPPGQVSQIIHAILSQAPGQAAAAATNQENR